MAAKFEERARSEQRAYYARTAAEYSARHEESDAAHSRALEHIAPLLDGLKAKSLLDVGAGAGRAVRFFLQRRPDIAVHGIEPVPELVKQAELQGVPAGVIDVGDGTALPYGDGAFDVVTSFGVLHHVAKPERVLREMMRVARRAVFVSDSNRFAQGRPLARYIKLAIHRAGLWPTFDFVRTRGRGYFVSEGDGVFYSYSVFDSLRLLRQWSPELMLFELECAPRMAGAFASPLVNASTLLVGAVKPQQR
jgi:ubiquinone/menaquinone biosynthesis C-methylase UbiE